MTWSFLEDFIGGAFNLGDNSELSIILNLETWSLLLHRGITFDVELNLNMKA